MVLNAGYRCTFSAEMLKALSVLRRRIALGAVDFLYVHRSDLVCREAI